MNYPVWELPALGGGLLIAIVAIIHVYIAQFAVGGGFYLTVAEWQARRARDHRALAYLRAHSRIFLLVTLVLGAVTGVGIWFTIGLVSPAGTAFLIRNFVWFWAIEWTFFLVEIAAALLYYYGWDRMTPRTHVLTGAVYAAAAWLSLAAISGIVSFMLTPGRWPETGKILDAFFNPGYVPSVIARTAASLALAGLWGLLTAPLSRDEAVRVRMVRFASYWLMPAFFALPLASLWFLAVAPAPARALALGGAAPVSLMFFFTLAVSVLVFFYARFGAFARPQHVTPTAAALVLVLGLIATGGAEWVREGIRKPYLVYGVLYSNGLYANEIPALQGQSILAHARWSLVKSAEDADPVTAGREVFRVQCMSCHTLDGYNAIRPLVAGWNRELLDTNIQHLDRLKGFMPPFVGTDAERRALVAYLETLNEPSRQAPPPVGWQRPGSAAPAGATSAAPPAPNPVARATSGGE